MRNLTEEEMRNSIEWFEGNKYLYELLGACCENEVSIYASCVGLYVV